MSEFTGERVIPELVDADLLNEHLARYRFAKHFAARLIADRVKLPLQILDAGCGSGYGTAELSGASLSVTGTDISANAVNHARERYESAGVRFLQSACESLPFVPDAFDLVVAFEVIEHLDRWRELLTEANRVLKGSGVLLVSTPNRDYYAESRGTAGPNPFHLHEFDYGEFRDSLSQVFAHVHIWTQNHAEAIVFAPLRPDGAVLEAPGAGQPTEAHFYLAACSQAPIIADDVFAWIPSSANVLRERGQHIAKLTGELEQKDLWLKQNLEAHSELQHNHEALIKELERQNHWADELNRELAVRNTRIEALQKELEERFSWIAGLESHVAALGPHIADLGSQIETARAEIERLNTENSEVLQAAGAEIERLNAENSEILQTAGTEIERLNTENSEVRQTAGAEIRRLESEAAELQRTLSERTAWAERLNAEIAEHRGELQRIGSSQWFRTGAKLGIGPRLRDRQ